MSDTPTITGPWRPISRIVWIVFTVLFLVIYIAGIPVRFTTLTELCAPPDCQDFLVLTAEEAGVLADWGLPISTYAAIQVGYEVILGIVLLTLGALIYWRRPNERFAFIVSLALISFGLNFLSEGDGALMHAVDQLWLTILIGFLTLLTSGTLLLLMYLFPNGRFAPGWMRYIVPIFVLAFVIVAVLSVIRTGDVGFITFANAGSTLIMLIGLLVGLAGQVYRYRFVSTPVERQQTRWVMLGLVLIMIAMTGWVMASFFLPGGQTKVLVNIFGMLVALFLMMSFPISLTISIVRYRLWDIDVVINRAVVYGLLTALLIGVYFGLVLVSQNAFVAITGQESQLAVVISTLAIAALFTPLRRRVQQIVDRRFYRQKYDAERTLTRFADAVRNEVDIDDVQAELLRAVNDTMQPKSVGLWLRERTD